MNKAWYTILEFLCLGLSVGCVFATMYEAATLMAVWAVYWSIKQDSER